MKRSFRQLSIQDGAPTPRDPPSKKPRYQLGNNGRGLRRICEESPVDEVLMKEVRRLLPIAIHNDVPEACKEALVKSVRDVFRDVMFEEMAEELEEALRPADDKEIGTTNDDDDVPTETDEGISITDIADIFNAAIHEKIPNLLEATTEQVIDDWYDEIDDAFIEVVSDVLAGRGFLQPRRGVITEGMVERMLERSCGVVWDAMEKFPFEVVGKPVADAVAEATHTASMENSHKTSAHVISDILWECICDVLGEAIDGFVENSLPSVEDAVCKEMCQTIEDELDGVWDSVSAEKRYGEDVSGHQMEDLEMDDV